MINHDKSSKAIHITLWLAQIVLAAGLLMGSIMKFFIPVEQLSVMWPWAGQVPVALVKFTGAVDFLGAIGLVLPSLLRIKPKLTPLAAICTIALMICASIFHILRGEASLIGVNIFFTILAGFVAWGRFLKAPISSK